MSSNMPTIMVAMSLLLAFDAVIGGKYFLKAGGFSVRLAVATLIFVVAVATKSNWLADLFYDKLWLIAVIAGTIVVGITLYDFWHISKRLKRATTRRCKSNNHCDSRRTTPARH